MFSNRVRGKHSFLDRHKLDRASERAAASNSYIKKSELAQLSVRVLCFFFERNFSLSAFKHKPRIYGIYEADRGRHVERPVKISRALNWGENSLMGNEMRRRVLRIHTHSAHVCINIEEAAIRWTDTHWYVTVTLLEKPYTEYTRRLAPSISALHRSRWKQINIEERKRRLSG